MRINYIKLSKFKRFKLANIADFEAEFPEPITMIIAESGKGKSSLLSQLNPLPATRTDFEKDGYKEVRITHDGSEYILVSDFSNKVSPHSFICNGVELNIGHTTDVQLELAEKHFSITPFIYDLVYAKTKLTKTTKSERRNLFLRINAMDLGLLLDAHKKVQSKIKDCKANLQMLQSRKVELEGSLLDSNTLAQHKSTRDKLQSNKQLAEQLIYRIDQHISTMKSNYADDFSFRSEHDLSVDNIRNVCKNIVHKLPVYTKVIRTDNLDDAKTVCMQQSNLLATKISNNQQQREALTIATQKLSSEINEYNKHLDTTSNNKSSEIEQSIKSIDEELVNYGDIKDTGLMMSRIDNYNSAHEFIIDTLLKLHDVTDKLITPEEILSKQRELDSLKNSLMITQSEYTKNEEIVNELSNEIAQNNEKANIPKTCQSTCGLRAIFTMRLNDKLHKIQVAKSQMESKASTIAAQKKHCAELAEYLEPYTPFVVTSISRIYNCLQQYFNYKGTINDLINDINERPMHITKQVEKLIDDTINYNKKLQLQPKREKLELELSTIIQTNTVSVNFIKEELEKKEQQVSTNINIINQLAREKTALATDKLNYELYLNDLTFLYTLQDEVELERRHQLVTNAYEYWSKLRITTASYISNVDTELRKLEQLVRDQELQQQIYHTEILANIARITEEKKVYETIEIALSPNTGIAHKSMVKYLNVLINNVNYFISQVWAYTLKLDSVDINKPIDYTLPVQVGSDLNKDISQLSDGQSEIMDLVWILTILLQLKLLNKMPFYADELTRCMDNYHRTKTMTFMSTLLDNKLIEQCFMINHFVMVSGGFKNSNIICLSSDNLTDIPENANEHVTITSY